MPNSGNDHLKGKDLRNTRRGSSRDKELSFGEEMIGKDSSLSSYCEISRHGLDVDRKRDGKRQGGTGRKVTLHRFTSIKTLKLTLTKIELIIDRG